MDNLSKEVLKEPTSPIYIVAKDNVILPIDGKQNKRLPESIYETQGWDEGLPFDCSTVNYIWNNHGKWIDYLNKQRPIDLDAINKRIDDLNKKHTEDTKAANTRMTAMQIKVGGYYFGGSENPATHLLYGTWVKLAADLTLRSAIADGSVTGNNDPLVPLKKHKHVIATNSAGSHSHTPTFGTSGIGDPEGGNGRFCTSNQEVTGTVSGGHLSIGAGGSHTHTATCSDVGENNPTLDVRGKHIPCVIWKRTA